MQFRNRILFLSLSALMISAILAGPADGRSSIENIRGKEYHPDERHGPWMIMVASFRDIKDSNLKKEGMSAGDAAKELVFELREKGIPAYTLSQEGKIEKIKTVDRLGNRDERIYAAQRDMICVLAGNYDSIDDATAQSTLAFIKNFKPKFMSDPEKVGAVLRPVSGGKGPFAGAFLTVNPNRNPLEVARRRPDNETKYLNSGIDFALVNVKKKYTVKVATFTGKSVVPLGTSKFAGNEESFDKSLMTPNSGGLARAGEDATQLTYALRQSSNQNRLLGADRFEAYVYHDKYQSIVTIGGFDSKSDPLVNRLVEMFQAKYKSDEAGSFGLRNETLMLMGRDPKGPPVHVWAFDSEPEVIEIPRIK